MSLSPSLASARRQPDDAADPKQEEATRAASELRERRLRTVEDTVLGTPEGREWLWALLSGTGVMGDRMVLNDAFQNGFQDGKRDVGERLMRRLMRSSPENFGRMVREQDRG